MKGEGSRLTVPRVQRSSGGGSAVYCGTGWGVREAENKGRPVITRAMGPFFAPPCG